MKKEASLYGSFLTFCAKIAGFTPRGTPRRCCGEFNPLKYNFGTTLVIRFWDGGGSQASKKPPTLHITFVQDQMWCRSRELAVLLLAGLLYGF